MLHVALSNRFDALLDTFVDHAGRLRVDPFEPLTVIVPSAAVQRALTLRLADRQGVCAHVDFSYPAAWLWRLIARAVPGVGAGSPFDPQVLAWRVYHALGDVAFTAPHARLAAWLRGADDGAGPQQHAAFGLVHGVPAAQNDREKDEARDGGADDSPVHPKSPDVRMVVECVTHLPVMADRSRKRL